MNVRKGISFIFLLVFFIVLAGCGSADTGNSESAESIESKESSDSTEEINTDPITMGLINWPENIAVNHVWKVILEEIGYEVELKPLDMGTIMAAVDTGDLDIGIEVWLPVQDISYYEEYKDTIDFAEEPWYNNGKVGLAVPAYMDHINSVEDLNEHKEEFNGVITGFEPGAGTMEVTEDLIIEYDLDLELLPSSEPAMLTALREAIKKEEAIVVPLWQPHGIFSELDLKFIDDPKEVYGGVEQIYMAKRQGFDDDYKEVNDWFNNWTVDDETIGELINFVVESEDHLEGAKEWVEENEDLVNEWTQ